MPPEPSGDTVAILSVITNRVLCVDRNVKAPGYRGGCKVLANRDNWDDPGPWELHEIIRVGTQVGFRNFITDEIKALLCADYDQGEDGPYYANRPDGTPDVYELFTPEVDGEITYFKNAHTGLYLNVDPNDPTGAVYARGEGQGPWEQFKTSKPLTGGGSLPSGRIQGRIRIDNRMMVNDGGLFRPVFASALSALAPGKPMLQFLDWVASLGFNGVRTFCGALSWAGQSAESARAALPTLLDGCQQRNLYIEVTCLTDTAEDPYNKDQHLAAIRDMCQGRDNVVIEIANEFYHDTQDSQVHDTGWLKSKVPMFTSVGLACAIGAPPEDEPDPSGHWDGVGGTYGTAHLDRGRDKWNQVRRVREIENCSATSSFPVWNNEPIGADEVSVPGKREAAPEFWFCMGALNRLFEVGGVFHFQAGLDTTVPVGPQQVACAQAFLRGFAALSGIQERLTYKNTGWADSPVADAKFVDEGGQVVRVYSGISGNHGYTVTVGETGDPQIRWQNSWSPVRDVDQMGSHDPNVGLCRVIEIKQG